MSFCARCQTYLASGVDVCPNCGALRVEPGKVEPSLLAELGETPGSSLCVAKELLLVPARGQGLTAQHATLHAIELPGGRARWHKRLENAAVAGIAVAGELLLVTTYSTDLLRGEGVLLALDATGAERWSWAPGVQRVSAPAVTADAVCVTVDTKTFVILDAATGTERNRAHLASSASPAAPAAAGGGVVYVPCRGPELLALALDGRKRWGFRSDDDPDAWLDKTPVVVGDTLYAVLTNGIVLALRRGDGSPAWRVPVGPQGRALSPPATDGERLYVGARDGLYALDLGDGRVLWHLPTGRKVEAAPLAAGDGVVYAASHDHNLYALDAETGLELWRVALGRRIEVAPIVSTDLVLAADHDGQVVAVRRAQPTVARAQAYADAGQRARAAALYEQAGAWRQAADLWEALGRPLEQANALVRYAESCDEQSTGAPALAAIWEEAARCYEAQGEGDRAALCRGHAARYRQWPILDLDVRSEGLVVDAWSRVQFILRNQGYGPAHRLEVHATGGQFEGQVMTTQRIATLAADSEREEWLDLRPLAHGDSVPLRVSVAYTDRDGQGRDYQETLYLPVARTGADSSPSQVNIRVSDVFKVGLARYRDFDLLIDGSRGAGYGVRVLRSPAGEASGGLAFPFDPEELAEAWQRLETGPRDDAFLKDLGTRLFGALLAGSVGSRFRSSQGMVGSEESLRLRLCVEAPELLSVPWELLYDPERREFLCLTRRTPVVRYLPVPRPVENRPLPPPLHMLVVPASPGNRPPLDVDREVTLLQQAVQPLVDDGLLVVEVLAPPTAGALRTYLVDRACHILHFIGHGGFDAQGGYISLEDDARLARNLHAAELRVLFTGTPLRLVVLAACLTALDSAAEGSSERAYLGVAPALVDAGVPSVVAMQFSLTDAGGRAFAQDFYQMLARHKPVEEAVDQARVAVMLEMGLGCRDWAAPVLFLRGDSGMLFPP